MAVSQTHLASICVVVLSLLIMLSSFEASRTSREMIETNGYDTEAYPMYFRGLEDGRFDSFIKLRDDILSLKSFARASSSSSPRSSQATTVSVYAFGARGDGKTDDTQAFMNAWKKVCSSTNGAIMLVPEGKTYLLKAIRFKGPCKSPVTIKVFGTLEASVNRWDYKDKSHWLTFDGVNNLSVDGGATGTLDGNGKIWWQNSCKINPSKPCTKAPTALTFYNSKNVKVNNVRVRNAQQIQVSFQKCWNVIASNVDVTAPEDSPNTDGIHITNSQNILLTNSFIATGDDCVSIESGSQNVKIKGITCGPGHGISIGSLGDDNSRAYVSGITVDGAKLTATENGVRIKTYQGGSGTANNIKFQNIEMVNVKNPIIIDQNYCDKSNPCKQQKSAVRVSNVMYKNIKGTSGSEVAIRFDCSKNYPCKGLVMENVNIEGGKAICSNAQVFGQAFVFPQCNNT